ncbi:iron-containing alcohol dehydrogenase [Pseudomonas extremaustralis]|jgi:butanol dehydrogenase|uniref:Iron-containing alcohol dehydrogenase n=1 Tax=Pseudomonas extremaustralis TaxID=359110 RepID=A0A5C5QQR9_9PSED|nr:iron-containing alcohol dehydrogenase [Pseudomonas extremaustralis]EZI30054.1 alcohol dehydrogenase [Pseudomonas extremaustralis 14-3 substr. 14-3b]MDF3133199.1 iron-containing alcohol dehydrogenase [Pseudomonas extremaustralis]MDG2965656.1 iron-containing alcohol dehydrogenase [Pseudomonas extremaustralis]TWS07354.1 iron-containing alcohol dehydrogenase [Pseudomonas extremaustralis]UUJ40917.1 iron-containing alcohol dehydrogenase [Pseudomonas extremaustralis]
MPALHYWNYPTEIFCGPGALEILAQRCTLLEMRKPLLVTDPGMLALEPLALLKAHLTQADIPFAVFSDIHSNPTLDDVARGVTVFQAGGHDSLIALGGGSAMDAAKGVALATVDRQGLARFEWSQVIERYPSLADFPRLDLPKLIALPTTAGTGSELGREAVLTVSEQGIKQVISHPELLPATVILDPILTRGLPAALTAATGMDALTHHIEAFCSPLYHPMSAGVAVEGIRLIRQHLATACADGQDMVAREGMLVASAMAAVAFQKGLGGVHALAHPLGARFHKHHGLLNAILLPYVLIANQPVINADIARLARYLELPQPDFDGFVRWVLQLRKQLGIPHSLSEIGLDADAAAWVGEQALADISSSDTNARPLDAGDYSQIFRNAVHGQLPAVFHS